MKNRQMYFIVGILVGVIMMISVSFSQAGQGQKKQYRKHNNRYERVYPQQHPKHHPRGQRYNHYKKRPRYNGHVYKRHYTWRQWRKIRKHNRQYRNGSGIYHHDDNGYLMFSFCNEEKGQRMCFSIGID